MQSTCALTPRAGGTRLAFLLLLAVVAYFPACGGSKSLAGGYPSEYPAWFLSPPAAYASGYARNAGYKDAAMREAAQVAATAFVFEESVTVNGGRGSILGPFGTVLAGPILEESYDYDRVEHYYDPERIAAVAHLEGMTVALLAKRKPSDREKDAVDERLLPSKGGYPDWAERPPEDTGGYTYVVGMSGKNEYEVTSWRTAERHARFRFALNTVADVKALYREGGIALVELDDVVVRGFAVVKRWRDPRDGGCFVLARAER